jgi:pimeloyl-ACP methyl ester carboxylesterase
MVFISHEDSQFYAVSFGSGSRTLLALGGWVGSWELWTEPFTQLSATWRTVAYDHRGSGATITPTESITFETMVDDVFVMLDALDIRQCVLAAESAGVAVALQAALRQPERFQGLVLVDGMYHSSIAADNPFLLGLTHHFEATLDQFVSQCVPDPNGVAFRRWGRQIVGRASQAAAIQLYSCMDGVDLRPSVTQITQPTLIIHGDDDRIAPLDGSRWLADHIPNAHLHIVIGAGHVPTVTHPFEVAQAINHYFEILI